VIAVPVMHVPFEAKYIVAGHPTEFGQRAPEVQATGTAVPAVATVYPRAPHKHNGEATVPPVVAQLTIFGTQAPETKVDPVAHDVQVAAVTDEAAVPIYVPVEQFVVKLEFVTEPKRAATVLATQVESPMVTPEAPEQKNDEEEFVHWMVTAVPPVRVKVAQWV